MLRFISRRLVESLVVVLGVSFLVFGVMFLSGDPVTAILGETATQEQVQTLRHQLGFDRPLYVQYWDFVRKAAQGNFGASLRQGESSALLVAERLPATFQLAAVAMVIALAVALPAGILAATRRNSTWDGLIMTLAMVGQAVPNFWLGILLILLFGVNLRLLPISGRGGPSHLVLPAITVAAFPMARNARMVRSCLLEVLGQDYIRTARSKGLPQRVVIWKHGLRNALGPVITLLGMEFGALLGGTVITETIFAWPGVGRLTVQALYGRDFPVVQASVTMLAVAFVLLNLTVDLCYALLNPRIRYQ